MTKRTLVHAQLHDARGWRQWAKDNGIGVNFTWQAIAEGRLKVHRVGKRMIVRFEDGDNFIRTLPEGPGARPVSFQKAAE